MLTSHDALHRVCVVVGLIAWLSALLYGVLDARQYAKAFTFWEHEARGSPNSWRAQNNCSEDFLKKGQWAMGLAYAERAQKLIPINCVTNEYMAYVNAGTAAAMLGAYELAWKYYNRAQSMQPRYDIAENLKALRPYIKCFSSQSTQPQPGSPPPPGLPAQ